MVDRYMYDDQSPSIFIPENIPFNIDYSEDGCPDTLAFNRKLGVCLIKCVAPIFNDTEMIVSYITGYSLGILCFILSYFYCFTSLLRPIMLRYPNSHIFHMMFCSMIFSLPTFLSLFLGKRYVFCDSNTEVGHDNWACKLGGMLIKDYVCLI